MEHHSAIAQTLDPSGMHVVLLGRVWCEKIIRDHPELAAHQGEVLAAVANPDHVAADPSGPQRTRYYKRGVGPSRWLLVVVSYEQAPARILTAFANRKDPRSWNP